MMGSADQAKQFSVIYQVGVAEAFPRLGGGSEHQFEARCDRASSGTACRLGAVMESGAW